MARSPELPRESIAAIALGAPGSAPRVRRAVGSRALRAEGPAGIVLGARSPRGGALLAFSLVTASALHTGVGASTLVWAPRGSAEEAAKAKPPLRVEHVVELTPPTPPPAPETPPEEPPLPDIPPAPPRETEPPREPSDSRPSPPAEAGQVLAADDDTSTLDFTGFSITTGSGPRYAGGRTAPSGTSARAASTPEGPRHRAASRSQQTSRARPVGLPARDWRCPWPSEAEELSTDEQIAVIRVVVRADGTVASAELVSDPGHGFGGVAMACARKQRFPAALDDGGRAITAMSPPIRVRFTRR